MASREKERPREGQHDPEATRRRVEEEHFELMRQQAAQQAERQRRDNEAAERMRTYGEGKQSLESTNTIAGPTGPTSSVFAGQEGDTGGPTEGR